MYYPVFLDLRDAPTVVVGAGSVAARKIAGLREAGARVRVVAPAAVKQVEELAARGEITWEARAYRAGDLGEAVLAVAATADPTVNAAVYEEARAIRIPVNVVDDPPHCTFILPALLRRGELTIAVSTGGASPSLAQLVREEIAGIIGEEYGDILTVLGEVRNRVLAAVPDPERRRSIFKQLAGPEWVRIGKVEGPDALRRRVEEFLKGEGL